MYKNKLGKKGLNLPFVRDKERFLFDAYVVKNYVEIVMQNLNGICNVASLIFIGHVDKIFEKTQLKVEYSALIIPNSNMEEVDKINFIF